MWKAVLGGHFTGPDKTLVHGRPKKERNGFSKDRESGMEHWQQVLSLIVGRDLYLPTGGALANLNNLNMSITPGSQVLKQVGASEREGSQAEGPLCIS